MIGDVDQCVEELARLVALGARSLILNPVFDEAEQLETLGGMVGRASCSALTGPVRGPECRVGSHDPLTGGWTTMGLTVPAIPHSFPRSGRLRAADTVVMVIDMQVEFCGKGGYVDRLGRDLAPLRAPVEPIRHVLAIARARRFRVVHTREGYQPDLSDLQPWKRWDNPNDPIKVGDPGPLGRTLIRGEPCWEFIPELRPAAGERVFDKSGFGAFASTDLDAVLRGWGVQNLVLTGVTTDCCVHSTLREAVDQGVRLPGARGLRRDVEPDLS